MPDIKYNSFDYSGRSFLKENPDGTYGVRGLRGLSQLDDEERAQFDAYLDSKGIVTNTPQEKSKLFRQKQLNDYFGEEYKNFSRVKDAVDAFNELSVRDAARERFGDASFLDGLDTMSIRSILRNPEFKTQDEIEGLASRARLSDNSLWDNVKGVASELLGVASTTAGSALSAIKGLINLTDSGSPFINDKAKEESKKAADEAFKEAKNLFGTIEEDHKSIVRRYHNDKNNEIVENERKNTNNRMFSTVAKDANAIYNKSIAAYNKGEITDEQIEQTYQNMINNELAPVYHGRAFGDKDELKNAYTPKDKLKMLSEFEAMASKYGQGSASEYVDNKIKEKVSENQGFLGKAWNNLYRDMGIGTVAFAMQNLPAAEIGLIGATETLLRSMDASALGAVMNLNDAIDKTHGAYVNAINGKDISGEEQSKLLNSQYWKDIDELHTFDSEEINKIKEQYGGISPYSNIYGDGTGDMFNKYVLGSVAQAKYVFGDLPVYALMNFGGGLVRNAAKAATKNAIKRAASLAGASRVAYERSPMAVARQSLKNANKAQDIYEKIAYPLLTAQNMSHLEGMISAEMAKDEISKLIIDEATSRYAVDADEYLNTPEGISLLNQTLQNTKDQYAQAGMHFDVNNQNNIADAAKSLKQDYINKQMAAFSISDEYRRKVRDAEDAAATSYTLARTIDSFRYGILNQITRRYMMPSAMRNRLENPILKYIKKKAGEDAFVTTSASRILGTKFGTLATMSGTEFLEEMNDGGVEGMSAALGMSMYNSYIGRNNDPENKLFAHDYIMNSLISAFNGVGDAIYQGASKEFSAENLDEGIMGAISPLVMPVVGSRFANKSAYEKRRNARNAEASTRFGSVVNRIKDAADALSGYISISGIESARAFNEDVRQANDRINHINTFIAENKDLINNTTSFMSASLDDDIDAGGVNDAIQIARMLNEMEGDDLLKQTDLYKNLISRVNKFADGTATKEDLDAVRANMQIDQSVTDEQLTETLKNRVNRFNSVRESISDMEKMLGNLGVPYTHNVVDMLVLAKENMPYYKDELNNIYTKLFGDGAHTSSVRGSAIYSGNINDAKFTSDRNDLSMSIKDTRDHIKEINDSIKELKKQRKSAADSNEMQSIDQQIQMTNMFKAALEDELQSKLDRLSKMDSADRNKVLSKDEILSMSAQDIWYMMSNKNQYSIDQQKNIDAAMADMYQRDNKYQEDLWNAIFRERQLASGEKVYQKLFDNIEIAHLVAQEFEDNAIKRIEMEKRRQDYDKYRTTISDYVKNNMNKMTLAGFVHTLNEAKIQNVQFGFPIDESVFRGKTAEERENVLNEYNAIQNAFNTFLKLTDAYKRINAEGLLYGGTRISAADHQAAIAQITEDISSTLSNAKSSNDIVSAISDKLADLQTTIRNAENNGIKSDADMSAVAEARVMAMALSEMKECALDGENRRKVNDAANGITSNESFSNYYSAIADAVINRIDSHDTSTEAGKKNLALDIYYLKALYDRTLRGITSTIVSEEVISRAKEKVDKILSENSDIKFTSAEAGPKAAMSNYEVIGEPTIDNTIEDGVVEYNTIKRGISYGDIIVEKPVVKATMSQYTKDNTTRAAVTNVAPVAAETTPQAEQESLESLTSSVTQAATNTNMDVQSLLDSLVQSQGAAQPKTNEGGMTAEQALASLLGQINAKYVPDERFDEEGEPNDLDDTSGILLANSDGIADRVLLYNRLFVESIRRKRLAESKIGKAINMDMNNDIVTNGYVGKIFRSGLMNKVNDRSEILVGMVSDGKDSHLMSFIELSGDLLDFVENTLQLTNNIVRSNGRTFVVVGTIDGGTNDRSIFKQSAKEELIKRYNAKQNGTKSDIDIQFNVGGVSFDIFDHGYIRTVLPGMIVTETPRNIADEILNAQQHNDESYDPLSALNSSNKKNRNLKTLLDKKESNPDGIKFEDAIFGIKRLGLSGNPPMIFSPENMKLFESGELMPVGGKAVGRIFLYVNSASGRKVPISLCVPVVGNANGIREGYSAALNYTDALAPLRKSSPLYGVIRQLVSDFVNARTDDEVMVAKNELKKFLLVDKEKLIDMSTADDSGNKKKEFEYLLFSALDNGKRKFKMILHNDVEIEKTLDVNPDGSIGSANAERIADYIMSLGFPIEVNEDDLSNASVNYTTADDRANGRSGNSIKKMEALYNGGALKTDALILKYMGGAVEMDINTGSRNRSIISLFSPGRNEDIYVNIGSGKKTQNTIKVFLKFVPGRGFMLSGKSKIGKSAAKRKRFATILDIINQAMIHNDDITGGRKYYHMRQEAYSTTESFITTKYYRLSEAGRYKYAAIQYKSIGNEKFAIVGARWIDSKSETAMNIDYYAEEAMRREAEAKAQRDKRNQNKTDVGQTANKTVLDSLDDVTFDDIEGTEVLPEQTVVVQTDGTKKNLGGEGVVGIASMKEQIADINNKLGDSDVAYEAYDSKVDPQTGENVFDKVMDSNESGYPLLTIDDEKLQSIDNGNSEHRNKLVAIIDKLSKQDSITDKDVADLMDTLEQVANCL